jgi:tetratricopeptide (TPR) repeat protein
MSVFSHKFQHYMHMAVVCLLCVAMFAACGRTRPAQSPPVVGSLPPIIDVRPDEAVLMPQAVQPRNIRQIHDRLFQDAQHHFQARDFPQAIQALQRLLALNPQAELEREGHWWLGQSYDQLEDWKSAQGEYRLLASAPIGQRYQSNSLQRLHENQGLLEQRELPPKHTQAIRFALHQLPRADGFDQGITKMKQDGATTLLIDLGCKRVPLPHASAKGSEAIPGIEELQSLLRLYAERSHHAGLLLYVGVNLRCLGHWAPSTHQVWRDHMYQLDTGRVILTQHFDLFHPAYQEFLARFLSRLCKEEVDGLVLLNDHPLGLFEGVTPIGVKRFEKQFGVAFDPSRIFYQGFDPLGTAKNTQGLSRTKDSLFWRWAGWKARERLTVLELVVDRLRSQYPSVQFGLELHPHGLTDPVGALVTYAEDSMDAAGRSFSFFFVRPEIDRRSTFTEQAVIAKLRRISTKAVLDRLLPVVDDPRRVWVSMPATGGQRLRPQAAVGDVSPLQEFPSGIGVVHDLRAFS